MPWPSRHVLLCSYPKPVSVGFMLAPTTMQDGWRDGNVEEASMFQPDYCTWPRVGRKPTSLL